MRQPTCLHHLRTVNRLPLLVAQTVLLLAFLSAYGWAVKEYMDWLAHHEFGLGHKPFRFASTPELPSGDLNSLDYWLELWINHYREALALDPHHLHFVAYEAYCAAPQGVLQRIVHAAGVDMAVPAYEAYSKVREVEGEVSPERLAQAQELYAEMAARGQS